MLVCRIPHRETWKQTAVSDEPGWKKAASLQWSAECWEDKTSGYLSTPANEHRFFPYIHNTSQRTSWQHPATHNSAVETCFCWCFWLLWVLSEHGSFPESLTATEVSGKNAPAKGSLGRRGRYLHSGMTNVCRGRAEGTIWDSVYQPSQPENP